MPEMLTMAPVISPTVANILAAAQPAALAGVAVVAVVVRRRVTVVQAVPQINQLATLLQGLRVVTALRQRPQEVLAALIPVVRLVVLAVPVVGCRPAVAVAVAAQVLL
jgi:hypothetical protein